MRYFQPWVLEDAAVQLGPPPSEVLLPVNGSSRQFLVHKQVNSSDKEKLQEEQPRRET